LFIPSAGLLSFLAMTAIVASVVTVFLYQGPALGAAYLTGVCVLLTVLAVLFVRWWPHTPVGRRILNLPRRQDGDDEQESPQKPRLAHLVGQRGHAQTKMLPSGAIKIDGRTYDAVSEGVPIERGQPVEVVEVTGNRIVVRPSRELPPTSAKPKDTRVEPLDMVVPDPFDDPLS
jgi:membrane-bound ClpP family serine protease